MYGGFTEPPAAPKNLCALGRVADAHCATIIHPCILSFRTWISRLDIHRHQAIQAPAATRLNPWLLLNNNTAPLLSIAQEMEIDQEASV